MKQVTIHEAKTHLSRLIREACSQGEEIVIAKGDTPMVRLVPISGVRSKRVLGLHSGQVKLADDFDAPLADFAEYR